MSGDANTLHDAIRDGELGVLSQAKASEVPGFLNVYVLRCPCEQSGCEIRVEFLSDGKQESAKILGTYTYPHDLATPFVGLFAPPEPTAG